MKRYPKGTWMRLNSGDTLKALIVQRGYTHQRLARYAGCSPAFISHLTSGRRTSCSEPLAHNIVEALDIPFEILFTPGDSTDGRSVPKFKGMRRAAEKDVA